MILQKHKKAYRLPEHPEGCSLAIWTSLGGNLIMVEQVGGDVINQLMPECGRPTMFAILNKNSAAYLRLWPTPDVDYNAKFRYSPPRKEL